MTIFLKKQKTETFEFVFELNEREQKDMVSV